MNKWCGDDIQVQAQKILVQEHEWIIGQKGLLSQGRTLIILDGDLASKKWLEFLVKKFFRVLIHGKISRLSYLKMYFQALKFEVDSELLLLRGDASKVLIHEKLICKLYYLPESLILGSINLDSSVNEIIAIQNLYLNSGLAPLPESFIRGEKGHSHTLVLKNNSQEIIGCATVQSLSRADSSYKNTAMVLCVSLHSNMRSMKISPLLNLAALKYGISQYGARQLYEIVESNNVRSFHMNSRCGLIPHETEGFIFVSMGGN